MTQLKHLSISLEQEYINPQIALEGLWDTIKGLFGHKVRENIDYSDSAQILEFLENLEKIKPDFKTDPIKSGPYSQLLLNTNGKMLSNWDSLLKRDISTLKSLSNYAPDKAYSKIVQEATFLAQNVNKIDGFKLLNEMFGEKLKKIPALEFKNKTFIRVAGSDFISDSVSNNQFWKTVLVDEEAMIPACTEEDLKKVISVVKNYTELFRTVADTRLDYTHLSLEDMSSFWCDCAFEKEDPNALKMAKYLADYSERGAWPYAAQIAFLVSSEVILSLSHWVHQSLVIKK